MTVPSRSSTAELSPNHRLGKALREYRERMPLTQVKLAERVHVSASLIREIEKGRRISTQDVIEACDCVLKAEGVLVELWRVADKCRRPAGRTPHLCPKCRHARTPAAERGELPSIRWRADEITLVDHASISPSGLLTDDPLLPDSWWLELNATLDALAFQRNARIAVRNANRITQEHVTGVIEWAFPGRVDTTVREWTCAHAGLTWANLTSPVLWLLGWENWGIAPHGLDAATLWTSSLAVPSVADRVWHERQNDLESRDGMLMCLFCLANVIRRSKTHEGPFLVAAQREADRLVAGLAPSS